MSPFVRWQEASRSRGVRLHPVPDAIYMPFLVCIQCVRSNFDVAGSPFFSRSISRVLRLKQQPCRDRGGNAQPNPSNNGSRLSSSHIHTKKNSKFYFGTCRFNSHGRFGRWSTSVIERTYDGRFLKSDVYWLPGGEFCSLKKCTGKYQIYIYIYIPDIWRSISHSTELWRSQEWATIQGFRVWPNSPESVEMFKILSTSFGAYKHTF